MAIVELPPRVTVGDLDPFPPCLFFTAMCHFLRAFDVCSSNMDFFMREPICNNHKSHSINFLTREEIRENKNKSEFIVITTIDEFKILHRRENIYSKESIPIGGRPTIVLRLYSIRTSDISYSQCLMNTVIKSRTFRRYLSYKGIEWKCDVATHT